MNRERVAPWRELAESPEDPVDGAHRKSQMEAEWRGASRLEPYENHAMWRRILAAHVQPMADAAD